MPAVAVPLSTEAAAKSSAAASQRYYSLDAYRGLIMTLLVWGGLGFGRLANDPFWGPIAIQFDHVKWEGVRFWDLIQPAFMFMAGAAMPFALANRVAQGRSFGQNFRHVLIRAAKLIAIAQLFTIVHSNQFRFGLINVLDQIALGYVVCFLLMQLAFRWQVAATALILAGHGLLFYLYPGPQGAFSMTGNVGSVIDQALLGRNYDGNYVTINFISSAVTMMFGVWTGSLMLSQRPMRDKLRTLVIAASFAMASGLALGLFIPIVKRIWTASFTLYSAGWVILLMLPFIWLVEIKGYQKLVFPLLVVGANSIFIYVVSQLFKGGIHRAVGVVTGKFDWLGTLGPVAYATATFAVIWYLCYWLYRRNIFFKV